MFSKRLLLAAGFAIAALTTSPSASSAQAPKRVTVEYQNARLADVVRAFASLSGQSIVLAPNAADLQVTASFTNVDWKVALDDILARQGLVCYEDAIGVLRVEKRKG
jgi:ferric-dicitrate binding protein FerR (iron transport regulator)